ncbi:hypothetical protein E4T43_07187 [Aureobasidium subglaciale]|nr:hypothetical protein E4T43_07187 [Aureobasidium subglaciale]
MLASRPLHDRRCLGILTTWQSDPKHGHLARLGRSLECGIGRLTRGGVELWLLGGAGYLDAVSGLESLRLLTTTRLSDFLDEGAFLTGEEIGAGVFGEPSPFGPVNTAISRSIFLSRPIAQLYHRPPPLMFLDSKAYNVYPVILIVPKRFSGNTNSQDHKDLRHYARVDRPCSAEKTAMALTQAAHLLQQGQ